MGEHFNATDEAGLDPNEVWREIRYILEHTTRIGPILNAYYPAIVQGLPDASTAASTIEKIELLRLGIQRAFARLALTALPSLQTPPKKRAQALALGARLDALLTQHDLTREDLRDAHAPPATPSKLKEAAELAKTQAAEDTEIAALARQISSLKRLFTGKHGFDRVLIYLWLDRLLITGTVPTPDQFILLLQQHAQRFICVRLVEEMQEAAGETAQISDEAITLLWLDLFWIAPPSPNTIYAWARKVTVDFMAAYGIPIAATSESMTSEANFDEPEPSEAASELAEPKPAELSESSDMESGAGVFARLRRFLSAATSQPTFHKETLAVIAGDCSPNVAYPLRCLGLPLAPGGHADLGSIHLERTWRRVAAGPPGLVRTNQQPLSLADIAGMERAILVQEPGSGGTTALHDIAQRVNTAQHTPTRVMIVVSALSYQREAETPGVCRFAARALHQSGFESGLPDEPFADLLQAWTKAGQVTWAIDDLGRAAPEAELALTHELRHTPCVILGLTAGRARSVLNLQVAYGNIEDVCEIIGLSAREQADYCKQYIRAAGTRYASQRRETAQALAAEKRPEAFAPVPARAISELASGRVALRDMRKSLDQWAGLGSLALGMAAICLCAENMLLLKNPAYLYIAERLLRSGQTPEPLLAPAAQHTALVAGLIQLAQPRATTQANSIPTLSDADLARVWPATATALTQRALNTGLLLPSPAGDSFRWASEEIYRLFAAVSVTGTFVLDRHPYAWDPQGSNQYQHLPLPLRRQVQWLLDLRYGV